VNHSGGGSHDGLLLRQIEIQCISFYAQSQGGRGYVNGLLRLAFLSPDLTEAILDGRQSERLCLAAIRADPVPLAWSEQRTRYA
jgi:hypothetical protein